MFNRLYKKTFLGIVLTIAALCFITYLSFVPYTIIVVCEDWNSKTEIMTQQASEYMALRLESIEHSTQSWIEQNSRAVFEPNLTQFEGNQLLQNLQLSNSDIYSPVLVKQNRTYYSKTSVVSAAMVDLFGRSPYAALTQLPTPTTLICKPQDANRESLSTYVVKIQPLIYEDQTAYLLVFYDPERLMSAMNLANDSFLCDTEIIFQLDSGEFYQLAKGTYASPTEGRSLPAEEFAKIDPDDLVRQPLDSFGFTLYFRTPHTALVRQCIYIAVPPLLLLLLLLAVSFFLAKGYCQSIRKRLESLIIRMNEYRKKNKEKLHND